MCKWISLILFFLASSAVQAQEKEVEYAEQTWFGYFNQTRLTNKSGIWLDLHFRLTENFAEQPALSMARFGYTYYLSDLTRLTAGYAYVTQYGQTTGAPNVPEHRLWQQVQWLEKKSWFTMMQWIRLEERFKRAVEAGELTSDYNFNYRIRFNMAFTIPLRGKQVVAKTPFIFLNDELHINFGEEIINNYFDQNRLFLGVGYQFTQHLNAQLGYMKVFQQLPLPNTFRNVDAIRLFVFHNLDFRKSDN